MAKNNLPENIENKIAYLSGYEIIYRYLKGTKIHLSPVADGAVEGRYPEGWPHSKAEIRSTFNSDELVEYIAPKLPDYYIKIIYRFTRKKIKLLDFYQLGEYLLVSSKAKQVIQGFDADVHQFERVELQNKDQEILPFDFYIVKVLRKIKFNKNIIKSISSSDYELFPKPRPIMSSVDKYLFPIINDLSLREYLLDKGIWSNLYLESDIFISGKLIEELKSAGCTGLEEFTRIEGDTKGEVLYYV